MERPVIILSRPQTHENETTRSIVMGMIHLWHCVRPTDRPEGIMDQSTSRLTCRLSVPGAPSSSRDHWTHCGLITTEYKRFFSLVVWAIHLVSRSVLLQIECQQRVKRAIERRRQESCMCLQKSQLCGQRGQNSFFCWMDPRGSLDRFSGDSPLITWRQERRVPFELSAINKRQKQFLNRTWSLVEHLPPPMSLLLSIYDYGRWAREGRRCGNWNNFSLHKICKQTKL